jgi:hypothetical protein
MTNVFGKGICLRERTEPSFARIFRPISADLQAAQKRLTAALTDAHDPAVREIVAFLLESPGKRIRPALYLGGRLAGDRCVPPRPDVLPSIWRRPSKSSTWPRWFMTI